MSRRGTIKAQVAIQNNVIRVIVEWMNEWMNNFISVSMYLAIYKLIGDTIYNIIKK